MLFVFLLFLLPLLLYAAYLGWHGMGWDVNARLDVHTHCATCLIFVAYHFYATLLLLVL